MQYWLMKTEPTSYSIDDLKNEGRAMWDGVRNYQARNFMRDEMEMGDVVFIYHSNTKELGIVGEGRVCSQACPDPTQFDEKSKYFDSKATKEKPRWFLVDICFKKKYKNPVLLERLRGESGLSAMAVLRPGNRLSITPVSKEESRIVQELSRA